MNGLKEQAEEIFSASKPEKKKNEIDFLGFFLAPLFVLITIEIMHLSHFTGYPQFFGTPMFLLKWLISYVFILLSQGVLLVIIPNLAAVHTIQTVIFYIMGFITEVMLKITGDPLLPSDLFLIDNMNEISTFVEIPLLAQCVISLLFAIFSVIFFFRRRKAHKTKINLIPRIALSLAVIMLFSAGTYAMCFNRIVKYRVFQKLDIQIAAFNPQADFYANGLILTFFPRIGELRFEKPEGYSAEIIKEIKSENQDHFQIGGVRPNVIAIQNEALWDVTRLSNTSFSEDPMKNIRKIGSEKNGKLGTFISPVFGGGTCMPEFEFLTGLSTNFLPASVYPFIQAVNRPTSSIVSSYRDNGYETFAVHTYKKNFYGRNKAYPLLGFDTFLGDEDLENPEIKGYYIGDMEVTRQLISAFENKGKDRIFEYAVTMQNHGAYTWQRYPSYDIIVENELLSDEDLLGVREFTQGVFDSDVAFAALVDYFRKVDEPTIIVMYGDHLPLLGTQGSTFIDSGYIELAGDKFNADDYPELHETPYIVWANYNVDLSDFASPISPANLGLSVYKLSGLSNTPWYYSLIDNFYAEYPVYSPYTIQDKNNVTISQSEEKLHDMAIEYKYVQYDVLRGKKTSDE